MPKKSISKPSCKINKQFPVYSGSHVIGVVRGNAFRKTISGSKHFLRQPPAIAVSLDALESAEKFGACWLEVLDRETNTTYQASIEHFRQDSFAFDRGYGKQLALVLSKWEKHLPGDELPAMQLPLLQGI